MRSLNNALNLDELAPTGHVTLSKQGEALRVVTTRALPTQRFDKPLPINSYVAAPGTYRLPLRIVLRVTLDAPGLYVLLGEGHVNFATPWSDNRRMDDILEPRQKTISFDNHMPLGRPVELTLIYGLKGMQILVDGELRYRSARERYMRYEGLAERNAQGFPLRIACDKFAELLIHGLWVTELEAEPPFPAASEVPPSRTDGNDAVPRGEKPTFEGCISLLPPELQREVLETDAFLRGLKPMKFRRALEKHGNKISYVASDAGFSYAIHPSEAMLTHTLQWYILTGSKPELWHRKANGMEATLNAIQGEDADFALRMFERLEDCVGCAPHCKVKTVYAFNGQRRVACHGKLRLKMCPEDFRDARAFIAKVNQMAAEAPQADFDV